MFEAVVESVVAGWSRQESVRVVEAMVVVGEWRGG